MANLTWYTSESGWMIQAAAGQMAIDSFRPCEEHPEGDRGCERCYDGPMAEEGHYSSGYDGEEYPIHDRDTDEVVAVHDWETGKTRKTGSVESSMASCPICHTPMKLRRSRLLVATRSSYYVCPNCGHEVRVSRPF